MAREIVSKREELLKIIEIATRHSKGRLRLAHNEEDDNKEFNENAQRFLKFDEKRIGRDIKVYIFLGDKIEGWPYACAMFLEEVLFPFKAELLKSYAEASEALNKFSISVCPEDLLESWHDFFTSIVDNTETSSQKT